MYSTSPIAPNNTRFNPRVKASITSLNGSRIILKIKPSIVLSQKELHLYYMGCF
jgi:hypothetical protein